MNVMQFGRLFIFAGLVLLAVGALLVLIERLNLPVGRLPGDIIWRGKNATVYFPWVTCLILSLVATLIMWLLHRRG